MFSSWSLAAWSPLSSSPYASFCGSSLSMLCPMPGRTQSAHVRKGGLRRPTGHGVVTKCHRFRNDLLLGNGAANVGQDLTVFADTDHLFGRFLDYAYSNTGPVSVSIVAEVLLVKCDESRMFYGFLLKSAVSGDDVDEILESRRAIHK